MVNSHFAKEPRESHCIASKRILRYVKGTIGYGLKFTKFNISDILAFCDADFVSDQKI